MKSICIKTNNTKCLDYLLNEFNTIDLKNVCFSSNKFKYYKNVIIHYNGNDDKSFISTVSSILSLLVIDELEEKFYRRLLRQNYFYFDNFENKKIIDICSDLTSEDFTTIFDKKYSILYDAFYEYLSSNKSINLDGFINFRIKSYFDILDDIVDEAVNTFIVEREYLEFISLLKLYINSQKSNADCIHLVYLDGKSILLDENKNVINIDDDTFKAKYLSDISFSSNDYALNTLLTLLPKVVHIHLINNYIDEFINTLQLVFEKRVILCTDCNICRVYKSQKKTIQ